MLIWFYRLPILIVCFSAIIAIIVWSKLYSLTRKYEKYRCIFNLISLIGVILSIYLILHTTIIGRTNDINNVEIKPLQSLVNAIHQPEIYRTMLMNIILFVPFGVTLTTLFSNVYSTKKCIILLFIISIALSMTIESIQFYFHLGQSQTDDVLCNVLGGLLGSMTRPLSNIFNKFHITTKKLL